MTMQVIQDYPMDLEGDGPYRRSSSAPLFRQSLKLSLRWATAAITEDLASPSRKSPSCSLRTHFRLPPPLTKRGCKSSIFPLAPLSTPVVSLSSESECAGVLRVFCSLTGVFHFLAQLSSWKSIALFSLLCVFFPTKACDSSSMGLFRLQVGVEPSRMVFFCSLICRFFCSPNVCSILK